MLSELVEAAVKRTWGRGSRVVGAEPGEGRRRLFSILLSLEADSFSIAAIIYFVTYNKLNIL